MIEPVFADTKFNRRIDRFQRRGRAAARSEWRLITATHNLLKLWRHTTRPRRPEGRPPRRLRRRTQLTNVPAETPAGVDIYATASMQGAAALGRTSALDAPPAHLLTVV